MVLEEPDIEIGAGVSSKGMSCCRSQGGVWCIIGDADAPVAISARRTTRDDRGGRRGQGNSPAQRGRNTSGGGMNDRRFQNNNNQQNYQNNNTNPNYQQNNNQNMGTASQGGGYGQMSGGINGGNAGFNGAAMPSAANLMQMMGFMNAQGMNFGGAQGQGNGQGQGQGGQGYR